MSGRVRKRANSVLNDIDCEEEASHLVRHIHVDERRFEHRRDFLRRLRFVQERVHLLHVRSVLVDELPRNRHMAILTGEVKQCAAVLRCEGWDGWERSGQ